jgi:hypothetical protein
MGVFKQKSSFVDSKNLSEKRSPTFDETNKQRSEAIRIFIIREVAAILQAAKSCVFILYCGRCCRAITSVLREEEHKRAPARAQKTKSSNRRAAPKSKTPF